MHAGTPASLARSVNAESNDDTSVMGTRRTLAIACHMFSRNETHSQFRNCTFLETNNATFATFAAYRSGFEASSAVGVYTGRKVMVSCHAHTAHNQVVASGIHTQTMPQRTHVVLEEGCHANQQGECGGTAVDQRRVAVRVGV